MNEKRVSAGLTKKTLNGLSDRLGSTFGALPCLGRIKLLNSRMAALLSSYRSFRDATGQNRKSAEATWTPESGRMPKALGTRR